MMVSEPTLISHLQGSIEAIKSGSLTPDLFLTLGELHQYVAEKSGLAITGKAVPSLTKPCYQRGSGSGAVEEDTSVVASGWMEELVFPRKNKEKTASSARSPVAWKEVLVLLLKKEGEENPTLWVKREVIDSESSVVGLETLHRIPMKRMERVEYVNFYGDHRLSLQVRNKDHPLVYRSAHGKGPLEDWVEELQHAKEGKPRPRPKPQHPSVAKPLSTVTDEQVHRALEQKLRVTSYDEDDEHPNDELMKAGQKGAAKGSMAGTSVAVAPTQQTSNIHKPASVVAHHSPSPSAGDSLLAQKLKFAQDEFTMNFEARQAERAREEQKLREEAEEAKRKQVQAQKELAEQERKVMEEKARLEEEQRKMREEENSRKKAVEDRKRRLEEEERERRQKLEEAQAEARKKMEQEAAKLREAVEAEAAAWAEAEFGTRSQSANGVGWPRATTPVASGSAPKAGGPSWQKQQAWQQQQQQTQSFGNLPQKQQAQFRQTQSPPASFAHKTAPGAAFPNAHQQYTQARGAPDPTPGGYPQQQPQQRAGYSGQQHQQQYARQAGQAAPAPGFYPQQPQQTGAPQGPFPRTAPQPSPSNNTFGTSPSSAKYAKMAQQPNGSSSEEKITTLKRNILIHWALQPPQFQILRKIPLLLTTIHRVFPPAFGVAAHSYFQSWKSFSHEDLMDDQGKLDEEKLKKGVRKLRFFLHPDKLPRDLNVEQSFMCKMLWDISNDAFEEYKKVTDHLDWVG